TVNLRVRTEDGAVFASTFANLHQCDGVRFQHRGAEQRQDFLAALVRVHQAGGLQIDRVDFGEFHEADHFDDIVRSRLTGFEFALVHEHEVPANLVALLQLVFVFAVESGVAGFASRDGVHRARASRATVVEMKAFGGSAAVNLERRGHHAPLDETLLGGAARSFALRFVNVDLRNNGSGFRISAHQFGAQSGNFLFLRFFNGCGWHLSIPSTCIYGRSCYTVKAYRPVE